MRATTDVRHEPSEETPLASYDGGLPVGESPASRLPSRCAVTRKPLPLTPDEYSIHEHSNIVNTYVGEVAEKRSADQGRNQGKVHRIRCCDTAGFHAMPRFAAKWWLWETTATLLSLGCLVTIIVLLARADSAPVSSWSSKTFTLNSLIATLSTLMRVSLMVPIAAAIGQQKWLWLQPTLNHRQRQLEDIEVVDAASRGPWGSLVMLLTHFNWSLSLYDHRALLILTRNMGVLGALLTLISLGLGTFTQLVITTRLASVSESIGSPMRTEHFTVEYNNAVTGLEFLSIIERSYYTNDQAELSMPACPTGNCEWPVFTTLAACGSCIDHTSSLVKNCTQPEGSEDLPQYCEWPIIGIFNDTFPQPIPDLESNIPYFQAYNERARRLLENGTDPGITSIDSIPLWKGRPLARDEFLDPARRNSTMFYGTSFRDAASKDNGWQPVAKSCTVQWCVQTINASVVNGTLHTKILDAFTDLSRTASGSRFEGDFETWEYSGHIPTGSNLKFNETRYARKWAFEAVPSVLQTIWFDLSGWIKVGPLPPYATDDIGFENIPSRTMYNVSDLDKWVDQLAIRLTNNIRQYNNVSVQDENYDGMAYAQEQVFEIRWFWLILPLALMLLSVLLLAATAWVTHDRGVEHWKNDALPLLYTSVDPGILEHSRRPEDMAKEYVTLLRTTEDSALLRSEPYEDYPKHRPTVWKSFKINASQVL
ncbi:Hypothetical protein D9617_1g086780 [Elsinoe fawcettii]|nr:Hypothetical protein D9617_1g086780 [Elsinoe fawcettii]